MTRVVGVVGHYWTPNYGDLLLRDLLVEYIDQEFGAEDISVINIDEGVFKEKKGVLSKLAYLLSFGVKSDVLILGGGGYFESTDPKIRKYTNEIVLFIFLINSLLVRLRGGRTFVYGVGVGPVIRFVGRHLIKGICSIAEDIVVRDDESQELLRTIGLRNVDVFTDGALVIGEKVASEGRRPSSRPAVAFHLMLRGGEIERVAEVLREIVDTLKHEADLYLISDNGPLGEERELLCSAETHMTVVENKSVSEFTEMLMNMDLVITTKLHVGIVSFSVGTAVFNLYRHPKCLRFYRQVDSLDRCTPLEEIETDVVNRIYQVFSELETTNSKVEASRLAVISKSKQMYERLGKAILAKR